MAIVQQKLDGHTEDDVSDRGAVRMSLNAGIINTAYKEAQEQNEVDKDAEISASKAIARAARGKTGEIAFRRMFPRASNHEGWKYDCIAPGQTTVEVKTITVPPELEGERGLFVPDHQLEYADYFVLMEIVKRSGQMARDAHVKCAGYVPQYTLKRKAEYINDRDGRFDNEGYLLPRENLQRAEPEYFPPKGAG